MTCSSEQPKSDDGKNYRRPKYPDRPSDPVAKRKELTLSDLEHIPLIVRMDTDLQSTTHTGVGRASKTGLQDNIAMRCESPEAVQSAVAQKLGIGFLYDDAVKAAIERGSFKLISIRGLDIEGQTYVVHHKERPLSPNAEEFLTLLREWRDHQSAKKPKPSLNTRVGARINAATCWAFAASALL